MMMKVLTIFFTIRAFRDLIINGRGNLLKSMKEFYKLQLNELENGNFNFTEDTIDNEENVSVIVTTVILLAASIIECIILFMYLVAATGIDKLGVSTLFLAIFIIDALWGMAKIKRRDNSEESLEYRKAKCILNITKSDKFNFRRFFTALLQCIYFSYMMIIMFT